MYYVVSLNITVETCLVKINIPHSGIICLNMQSTRLSNTQGQVKTEINNFFIRLYFEGKQSKKKKNTQHI